MNKGKVYHDPCGIPDLLLEGKTDSDIDSESDKHLGGTIWTRN
jgi:hypothetical protein